MFHSDLGNIYICEVSLTKTSATARVAVLGTLGTATTSRLETIGAKVCSVTLVEVICNDIDKENKALVSICVS
jgi:hypothetical protein